MAEESSEEEMHFGYLMGLTAGYLDLVNLLIKKKVITRDEITRELSGTIGTIKDLPDAKRWLEVTIKNIGNAEDEPHQAG